MSLEFLAAEIGKTLGSRGLVQVEASARHVHLCKEDVEKLFGVGAELTFRRALSQKGEFLCEERLDIVTESRTFLNVAVLGPVRPESQVELSLSDGVAMGMKLPIRFSGDLADTPGVLLRSATGSVQLESGCIAALRHLHAPPEDALMLGISDRQVVAIEILGTRRTVFHNVHVRVKDSFRLRVHLDMDEANAADMDGFTLGRLIV
jgi:putative phosphotransacetylase